MPDPRQVDPTDQNEGWYIIFRVMSRERRESVAEIHGPRESDLLCSTGGNILK